MVVIIMPRMVLNTEMVLKVKEIETLNTHYYVSDFNNE